jgi:CheY-like chemotaxis protein
LARTRIRSSPICSRFILHLPISLVDLAKAPESRESEEAACPFAMPDDPSLAGLKVLVVDDELDTREILQRLLASCDARVLLAASAREALTLLRQEKPHVLVSDIGMPHEDGYWLIQQVRALAPEEGGSIPALPSPPWPAPTTGSALSAPVSRPHTAKPVETAELIYLVAGLAGRTGRRPRRAGAE